MGVIDAIVDWHNSLSDEAKITLWAALAAGSFAIVQFSIGPWNLRDAIGRLKVTHQKRAQQKSDVVTSIESNLPAQLDPVLREELEQVYELLSRGESPVILIGPPGVGKSTIALAVGGRLKNESDIAARRGQLRRNHSLYFTWLSFKGQHYSYTTFLDALGMPFGFQAMATELTPLKETRLRHAIAATRMLLIVDNFESLVEDTELVFNFLASLPEATRVVVTTQYESALFTGSVTISVGGMTDREADQFIQREVARLSRIPPPRQEEISKLISVTGGIPLALQWVLGLVMAGRATYGEACDSLLKGSGDIFHTLFDTIWSRMDSRQRLLASIIANLGVPVSSRFLTVIQPVFDSTVEGISDDLVRAQIVTRSHTEALRVFSIHPLAEKFILQQAYETGDQWMVTVGQAYIEFLKRLDESNRDSESIGEAESEMMLVTSLLDLCYKCGVDDLARQLTQSAEEVFFNLGLFDERIKYSLRAADSAYKNGDLVATALFLTSAGGILILQGEHGMAEEKLQEALRISISVNDVREEARAKRALASNRYRSGEVESALEVLEGVDELSQRVGDNFNRIDALYLRGHIRLMLDSFAEAGHDFREMLQLSRDVGWERAEAYALKELAELSAVDEDYEIAAKMIDDAIALAHRYRDRRQLARCQLTLGKLLAARGERKRARENVLLAESTFEQLRMANEAREAIAWRNALGKNRTFFPRKKLRFRLRLTDAPIGGD